MLTGACINNGLVASFTVKFTDILQCVYIYIYMDFNIKYEKFRAIDLYMMLKQK